MSLDSASILNLFQPGVVGGVNAADIREILKGFLNGVAGYYFNGDGTTNLSVALSGGVAAALPFNASLLTTGFPDTDVINLPDSPGSASMTVKHAGVYAAAAFATCRRSTGAATKGQLLISATPSVLAYGPLNIFPVSTDTQISRFGLSCFLLHSLAAGTVITPQVTAEIAGTLLVYSSLFVLARVG